MLYPLFSALSLGSIYAIVALAFVVVFKASGVLNFALGSLAAAGGLIMASLVGDAALGLAPLAGRNPLAPIAHTAGGWVLNLAAAMALAGLLGLAVERLALRPLRNATAFSAAVLTIGVAIVVDTVARNAPVPRDLAMPWAGTGQDVLGVAVPRSFLVSMAMAAVAFAGVAAFYRTRFGIATRAVAVDREAATAQGIDPGRVTAAAWAMAAALATLGAMAWSMSPRGPGSVNPGQLPDLTFRALPVLVVGGLDSARGALVGGLAIGGLEVLAGEVLSGHIDLLGAGYQQIVPYVVMVVVLLVRPYGLAGTPTIRRV